MPQAREPDIKPGQSVGCVTFLSWLGDKRHQFLRAGLLVHLLLALVILPVDYDPDEGLILSNAFADSGDDDDDDDDDDGAGDDGFAGPGASAGAAGAAAADVFGEMSAVSPEEEQGLLGNWGDSDD